MTDERRMTAQAAAAAAGFGLNFVGIGIFVLALGVGTVVRLFIPDAVMYGPKEPLSTVGSIVAMLIVIPFLLWLALWFRTGGSVRLTGIGAGGSALLALLTAFETWRTAQWSLLPGLAIITSFAALTFTEWLRLKRRAAAAGSVTPP